MQKTTIFSAILVIALPAFHVAWAGPTEDRDREAARISTKKATAAFNLGHYDEAASLYEEAYKLVPDPILLYDLGQSYRQANKLDKALIAYRSYMRTAPADAPNRKRVEAWVHELELAIDLQAKTAAQKAPQEKEDATPVVPKPTEASKPAEPAQPQIQPQEEVSPPPTRSDLVSQTATAQQSQPSAGWKKWAPWVGAGITAAVGVATIVEGVSARSSFSDLQGSCGKTRTCTDSQVDGVKTKATVTNVLLGVTAASAAATGILFYFSFSGSKETTVSLSWRF